MRTKFEKKLTNVRLRCGLNLLLEQHKKEPTP